MSILYSSLYLHYNQFKKLALNCVLNEQNMHFYPQICTLSEIKFHLILKIRVLSEIIPLIENKVKKSEVPGDNL